jgi:tetratricopeptide (TPR) repeat protein
MRIVKVFLASSAEEMEQADVGNFFRVLNDSYRERDLYFRLFFCEGMEDAFDQSRKQREYQKITETELAFFLFHTQAGVYAEEFDLALDSFRQTKQPKIVTYFKTTDTPTEEILAFKTKLDHEIGHYYNTYSQIDTLKLGILMQIKRMGLDGVDIRIEDGRATQNGMVLASLEQLPMVLGHEELQRLKAELTELDTRFYEAQECFFANPNDDETHAAFYSVSQRRNEAKARIRELEERVYSLMEYMFEQTSSGQLSRRQVEGYRLLEAGKYKEADAALDFEEIMSEIVHDGAVADQWIQQQQIHVNELLQKADIQRPNAFGAEAWVEVERCYITAVQMEEAYNLPKQALYHYVKFLMKQNRLVECVQQAERLQKHYELAGEAIPQEDWGRLYTLLGRLYDDTRREQDAENAYKAAIDIWGVLIKHNSGTFAEEFARCHNWLGNMYLKTNRTKEAVQSFETAEKELLRAVDACLPDDFTAEYKNLYSTQMNDGILTFDIPDNLTERVTQVVRRYIPQTEMAVWEDALRETTGDWLSTMDIMKDLKDWLIEQYAPSSMLAYLLYTQLAYGRIGKKSILPDSRLEKNALNFFGNLVERDPEAYAPYLMTALTTIEDPLYWGMSPKMEDTLKQAIHIARKMANRNPAAGEPYLALACRNLGVTYIIKGHRATEAEPLLIEALNIWLRLAADNADAFARDIAIIYAKLGKVYAETKRWLEAEMAYQFAIDIWQPMAELEPDTYEKALSDTYIDLGDTFKSDVRITQADMAYNTALGMLRGMAERRPGLYEKALAKLYSDLAFFYQKAGQDDKREEAMKAEIEVMERINKRDASQKTDLKIKYQQLGDFYKGAKRYAEAESPYKSALALEKQKKNNEKALSESYDNLAQIYMQTDRLKEAQAISMTMLAIKKRDESAFQRSTDTSFWAGVYDRLFRITGGENWRKEAEAGYQTAVEQALQKAEGSSYYIDQKNPADKYSDLGDFHLRTGQLAEAEAAFTAALGINKQLVKEHPNTDWTFIFLATGYAKLGNIYIADQRYEQAEAAYMTALETTKAHEPDALKKNFGRRLADSFTALAKAYKVTGRYPESDAADLAALEIERLIEENALDSSAIGVARANEMMGGFYVDACRYAEAESAYQTALSSYQRLAASKLGEYESQQAQVYDRLIEVRLAADDYPKAESAGYAALNLYSDLAGKDPANYMKRISDAYVVLGNICCCVKQEQEAGKHYLAALDIAKSLAVANPGVYSGHLADIYNALGSLYINSKRDGDARIVYKSALVLYKKYAVISPAYAKNAEDVRAKLEALPLEGDLRIQ